MYHVVATRLAMKNRMDLSLTNSVGSATQVAFLVLPTIILVGFAMDQPMGLVLVPIELIALSTNPPLIVPVPWV